VFRRLTVLLRRHEKAARRCLLLALIYGIPAALAVRAVVDPDLWWQMRTWQWIWQHGRVPRTDPFSSYGMGKPWAAYSWLFELLIYGIYSASGLMGVLFYRVIFSVLIVAAVHLLISRREPRFVLSVGITALVMFALLPVLNERHYLFSIFFYTITLHAVFALRAGREGRAVWGLPLVYVLWANTHIQFVYGLFVLCLMCVAPILDRLLGWGQPASVDMRSTWHKMLAITCACFAATLVNPYSVRLYPVILNYATQTVPYAHIAEFGPMSFRSPSHWAVLALFGAAFFVLGRRRSFSSFDILLLTGTAYFSFRVQRDVWFLAIAAAGVAVPVSQTVRAADRFVLTRQRVAAIAGIVVAAVLLMMQYRHISAATLDAAVAELYPVQAAAFVDAQGYAGPLYNSFNWGGYLIWRLPRLPVAMDGRTDVHGDARSEQSLRTWLGEGDWASDPELSAAHVVIAEEGAPLTALLKFDPRFELAHEDRVAAVFVARPSKGAAAGAVGTEPGAPSRR
jgi:hypothetical protein